MDIILTKEFLGTEEEADLVEWSVENGATVAAGDTIAQLETSKLVTEFAAPTDGVITHKVAAGEVISVDEVFATIA